MASSRNSRSTDDLDLAIEALLTSIPHGSKVAVAFSGGLDSSVLLSLSTRWALAGSHTLSAVHVHHGLSPHADAWADFCRDICVMQNVPLEIIKVEVPHSNAEGLEASARRLRYQALKKHAADYVLLAHHANDQAETLLFNLMRGAGVRGAAAMRPITGEVGRYLRPLLHYPRAALVTYAEENGLRWIDDESNDDVSFSRNYIRHQVMPVLEKRFPAAVDNLLRATELFAEAQEMLDEMACQDLAEHSHDFPISVALLRGLSAARARNVLRYVIGLRGLQAPSGKRLEEALRQFIDAKPDRHPSLQLSTYRLLRAKGMIKLILA